MRRSSCANRDHCHRAASCRAAKGPVADDRSADPMLRQRSQPPSPEGPAPQSIGTTCVGTPRLGPSCSAAAASTVITPNGVWCTGWQDLTTVRLAPVPLYRARVLVSLRPSVLDPAGEATRAAAARLGVNGVQRLRIGKAVDVELEADGLEAARAQLELLSDRLLANPVIENWTLELLETAPTEA